MDGSALLAVYPGRGYATKNFLEADFRGVSKISACSICTFFRE
jgi:hypothetical protein